jgi:hypothetical protein
LHNSRPEDAVRTAVRIALIVAIPVLIIYALAASVRPSSAVPDPFSLYRIAAVHDDRPIASDDRGAHREEADDAAGAVDLYGNEVTDAVAKYKADRAGALYELHSPQTEVPRLASPKS